MFISKHRFFYFDAINFFLILALSVIGLTFIFSATYTTTATYSIFFKKQCIGIIGGIILYFICLLFDYRSIFRWGYIMYFLVIAILIFTLLKGHVGMGAQRWINCYFFKLQPSELVKLFFPIHAAFFIQTVTKNNGLKKRHFFILLLTIAISFLLVLKQPDLGTALVIAFSGLLICYMAGLTTNFFLYTTLLISISSPFIWHTVLKNYQKKRILVFLGYGEKHNERYQIEQAKIAIGSGGITGKGFLKGTQNKYRFLPEGRTDFIFAVLCEEMGLLGALIVLCLYCILFFRILTSIVQVKNQAIQICAIGLVTPIILATIINICMVLALLPIVGIPLPLISYGISNLWITFISLGILQNNILYQ